jgi:hypothetical protein
MNPNTRAPAVGAEVFCLIQVSTCSDLAMNAFMCGMSEPFLQESPERDLPCAVDNRVITNPLSKHPYCHEQRTENHYSEH